MLKTPLKKPDTLDTSNLDKNKNILNPAGGKIHSQKVGSKNKLESLIDNLNLQESETQVELHVQEEEKKGPEEEKKGAEEGKGDIEG